uniref:Uncharacterized protein n=1 Tax=Romanomermis culicivorax TaxID=13658 RepID=A0A915IPH6_ROMCU
MAKPTKADCVRIRKSQNDSTRLDFYGTNIDGAAGGKSIFLKSLESLIQPVQCKYWVIMLKKEHSKKNSL